MARAVGQLVVAGMGLLACGGRYDGSSQQSTPGAGAMIGAGAATSVGGAAGTGVGAPAGGGADGGLAGSTAFVPFPVATTGEQPDLPGPPWTEYTWSPAAEAPAGEICDEGWTLDDAQAAVERHNSVTSAARVVDGSELAALLNQLDGPHDPMTVPGDRVMHFFALPNGETGVVFVSHNGADTLYFYLRIARDCSVENLTSYLEDYQHSCEVFGGAPLWGIPAPSMEWQQCRPSNGFYGFDAQVGEDSCGLTPVRFTGVFGFRQLDPTSANLWFPDLAGHPLKRQGYDLGISGKEAGGTAGELGAPCYRYGTRIELVAGPSISISDERYICDEAGERYCTWKMHSTRIYGPL